MERLILVFIEGHLRPLRKVEISGVESGSMGLGGYQDSTLLLEKVLRGLSLLGGSSLQFFCL